MEKFLTLWNFKARKSTSELRFCLRTADLQITMLWIKEVEIAKSIDELVRQHNFPDFDMLDALIASALKKLLSTQSIFQRHALRCDPGRIVQVKFAGLCSASDCPGFVRPTDPSK